MTFPRGRMSGAISKRPTRPAARKRNPRPKEIQATVVTFGSVVVHARTTVRTHAATHAISTPVGIQNARVTVRLLERVKGRYPLARSATAAVAMAYAMNPRPPAQTISNSEYAHPGGVTNLKRFHVSAGRPLIAEVRTHALGNAHYPGYSSHYEQNGYSVPHFILIIGYDGTGVWLNDPGISWGRGYHISYAQLAHAIDSLDQHHPALNQGQVLLLLAPEKPVKVRAGNI